MCPENFGDHNQETRLKKKRKGEYYSSTGEGKPLEGKGDLEET